MWGSERAQACAPPDASSKRFLRLWTSLWTPVPKARSSKIALFLPSQLLGPEKQQLPHTKHTAYRSLFRKAEAPAFSDFCVFNSRGSHPSLSHTLHAAIQPPAAEIFPGMPHAGSVLVRQRAQLSDARYSYGPGPHRGGTPYITGRIVFRKALSHALSLSVLALHASVVRSARGSRCNAASPLSCL